MSLTFGLIGKNLEHSFSEKFFMEKFQKEGLKDFEYRLMPIPKIDLIESIFTIKNLGGLNVTLPYKESILPFLDELSPDVQAIGAVNCIQIENGHSSGWNTDWIGFLRSIRPFLEGQHERALIFGSGGSAKAVGYALRELGVEVYRVSRTPKKGDFTLKELTIDHIKQFKLLVNCTPVGMFPKGNELLPIPYNGIGKDHLVVDLVYNPEETLFLKKAKAQGATVLNGYPMLVFQAEASWKIWNPLDKD